MPSSEDIYEARTEVRNWYFKNILIPKYGDTAAAREILNRTSYEEMKEPFAKTTGKWMGVFSSY